MKRAREECVVAYHPISMIPLDVWPIILACDGDCLFSLACVSKECLAMTKHAVSQKLYGEMSNAEIVDHLHRFPVRAYYTLSARHYAKNRLSRHHSERYMEKISGLLIKHVLTSFIDRSLTPTIHLFDCSGAKVLMNTTFHIRDEDTKHWIQYCIEEKYRGDLYEATRFIKETLDAILCTPKPTKPALFLGVATPNYFSSIELCFHRIQDSVRLRATHPTFAKPGFYDFNL